jgi:hypothetical protein
MKANVLKDAAKTGERVVERFTASKEAVSDAWDDTRHFVHRTRRTIRDLLGEAKYNIKRFPIRSGSARIWGWRCDRDLDFAQPKKLIAELLGESTHPIKDRKPRRWRTFLSPKCWEQLSIPL